MEPAGLMRGGIIIMENALLPEVMPPREVLEGRYRFRTPLRSEGVGRLDCVEDMQTGRRRVVHWLPLEVNRQNHQNIIHLCAALPLHPCLPEVCEVGEVESWAFMVLDFPEGELLSARQGILKPETWRKMACQLSGALSVLHAQHILHGEVCMASIMAVGPEQYLLWDMPLVLSGRMADRRQGDRFLHQLSRTVETMAPERARGSLLSPELDVYSLGAVLAYSVGSQQPTSSSVLTVVHAIATGNFRPHLPDILPPLYRDMLGRMLSPRPADRPSMNEIEAFFLRPLTFQTPSSKGLPRAATPVMGQPVLQPMQLTPAPFPLPSPVANATPGMPAIPMAGHPRPPYPAQPLQPYSARTGQPLHVRPTQPPAQPIHPAQPYSVQPVQLRQAVQPSARPTQPLQPLQPQPLQPQPLQPLQRQAYPQAGQARQTVHAAQAAAAPPLVSGVEWMHTLPSQEVMPPSPPAPPPPSELKLQETERELGMELKTELEAEWEAEEEPPETTDSFSRF